MAKGAARRKGRRVVTALRWGTLQARALVVEPVSSATWLVVDGEVVPFTRLSAQVPPCPAPHSPFPPLGPPPTTTPPPHTHASSAASLRAALYIWA